MFLFVFCFCSLSVFVFFCAETSGWPWMVMLTLSCFVTLGVFFVVVAASTVLLNGTVDDCMSCCLLYCLSVCQSFLCVFCRSVFLLLVSTWLEVDSLIDRSIDWLIDRLVVGWLVIWLRSFIYFDFAPCVHERCDPCEFLLALRGFVELISVMVRFRSSVLFRPRPPRCDWKLPRLGPWARSRTSKGSPPQPEFLKPNTVQKASFLSSKRLRFSHVLAIWRVGYLKPYSWNQYTHRFEA